MWCRLLKIQISHKAIKRSRDVVATFARSGRQRPSDASERKERQTKSSVFDRPGVVTTSDHEPVVPHWPTALGKVLNEARRL